MISYELVKHFTNQGIKYIPLSKIDSYSSIDTDT